MSATATLLATTALVFSPVSAAPPPTYFLGGTDLSGTGIVTEGDINWILNGNLTGAQNVPYPRSSTGMNASVGVGADAIVDILDAAEGPVRIAGTSQGALAIAEAKRTLMARDEADRPDADEVTFLAIGDPSGPTGIGSRLPGLYVPYIDVTFQPAPETPYDTIIVTREYDGLADFPDRPLNFVATLNALAGIVYVHPVSYGPDTDLEAIPDEDVTETVNSLGGRTTSYFVQNDRLPLLQPLRDLNVDERLIAAIEQPLKQVVDAGYSRNDGRPGESESDDTEAASTKADTTEAEDTKADDPKAEKKAKRAERPEKAASENTETEKAETAKNEPSDDSEKAA
jgi:diacyltrehalose acyltransferase